MNGGVESLTKLDAARSEFNKFVEDSVYPLLGLTESERAKLGFADIASRIPDRAVKQKYCALAITMLNANIAHYRPEATKITVSPPNGAIAVVLALLAAAAGLHFSGGVSALIAAALAYWVVETAVQSNHEAQVKAAEEHNNEVADWEETLRGWENAWNELHDL